ncbi:DUF1199 domain-containing protein [Halorubrum sp. SS7]|nr:DUF1199 domain-containing protein [Halorubrum sp. SP3]TKX55954.1 DUF1199 domain-containing protein [Halorubrum sp. SS7]TKX61474.1 DUF1199 domain-containing protein [Halorubrum sp. SP9]
MESYQLVCQFHQSTNIFTMTRQGGRKETSRTNENPSRRIRH